MIHEKGLILLDKDWFKFKKKRRMRFKKFKNKMFKKIRPIIARLWFLLVLHKDMFFKMFKKFENKMLKKIRPITARLWFLLVLHKNIFFKMFKKLSQRWKAFWTILKIKIECVRTKVFFEISNLNSFLKEYLKSKEFHYYTTLCIYTIGLGLLNSRWCRLIFYLLFDVLNMLFKIYRKYWIYVIIFLINKATLNCFLDKISTYVIIYLALSLTISFFYRKDISKFKLNISSIFLCSFCHNLYFLYKINLGMTCNLNTNLFLFNYLLDNLYLNIYFSFNLNSMSLLFIILNNVVIITCIIWSWNYNYNVFSLYLFFIFLDFLLKCCFLSHDIFTFFIFFESILISIFFFIGVLGSHKRKVKAIYLFYMYTLLGSFFMLFGIITLIFELGHTNVILCSNYNLIFKKQLFIWPLICLSFLIKIPVYPFHLWLPEAHVEASTMGSVFLAAVLLKLGGFGLIKFIIPTMPYACIYYTPFIEVITCLGFFYCSVITIQQNDFKKIVAYSSVVHMHLVLFSLFSFTIKGFISSVLLMISHGLTSAAIFFCLGVLYERFLTRNVPYIKNIVTFMPIFSTLLFLLVLSNTSFPGTLNFISELCCLVAIFATFKSLNLFFIFLGLVLNTYYNFWFFNRISFGNSFKSLLFVQDASKRETYILMFFIFWIIFFGFFPGILISSLENYVMFLLVKILS